MTIFRHKENQKLYTIEHFIHDHKHLNRNSNCGIYAYPYYHDGEIITFINTNLEICDKFVKYNFDKISEK